MSRIFISISLWLSASATTGYLSHQQQERIKVKPRRESKQGKLKDKGRHGREEPDTADSGELISAERSDSLVGPNWINVIINMLRFCVCTDGEAFPSCMKKQYVCMNAGICIYKNIYPPPKVFFSGSPATIFPHRKLSTPFLAEKEQKTETPTVAGRHRENKIENGSEMVKIHLLLC